ncbi:helix-turn-helix domain-containing protein [Flavobacteriaceae bacterium M23B6Z8]
MLASKSQPTTQAKYELTINIDYSFLHLVKVSLFDSKNREIKELDTSNAHHRFYELDFGLYTLRLVMNGEVKDHVFLLDKNKTFQIDSRGGPGVITPPKQFSSVLLGEIYESSHEYYTDNAVKWSQQDTLKHQSDSKHAAASSSLFIFLRFASREHFKKLSSDPDFLPFNGFKLTDTNGKQIAVLDEENSAATDFDDGWLAFNCRLSSGSYYLFYEGKEPRQIPVNIFENWHTQLFLTLDEKPLFGTLRIFLAPDRFFDLHNETYKYIDILLNKLQNRNYSLGKELIEMAAYGKFRSPMLGLIAAYTYLKSKETHEDRLFKIITTNMQETILKNNEDAPDLRALSILASQHFENENFPKTVVKGTPMLRIGFEALLKASIKYKRLIKEGSVNDFISENLYFDSPFNTFKPIPFPEERKVPKRKRKKTLKKRNPRSENLKDFEMIGDVYEDKPKTMSDDLRDLIDNASKKLFEAVEEAQGVSGYGKQDISGVKRFSTPLSKLYDKKLWSFIEKTPEENLINSWVKQGVFDLVNKDKKITMNDISKDLGISRNTVNRIFREWQDQENKE